MDGAKGDAWGVSSDDGRLSVGGGGGQELLAVLVGAVGVGQGGQDEGEVGAVQAADGVVEVDGAAGPEAGSDAQDAAGAAAGVELAGLDRVDGVGPADPGVPLCRGDDALGLRVAGVVVVEVDQAGLGQPGDPLAVLGEQA